VSREVLHMRLHLGVLPSPRGVAPEGIGIRLMQADEGQALGTLMWNAYRGTVDDEYASPAESLADAEDALAGKWGPLIAEASLAAVAAGDLIAAVITVRDVEHEMLPLLAFALTEPKWQRRGIGGWLIQESIARLSLLGVSEVHLAVTRGNPAQQLYERIGFRVVV
jgi:GNAT superfamily N-acetyltransferase